VGINDTIYFLVVNVKTKACDGDNFRHFYDPIKQHCMARNQDYDKRSGSTLYQNSLRPTKPNKVKRKTRVREEA